VPIVEIRIDEDLWIEASDLRRQDWRTLIADLLDEGPIAPESIAHRMIVGTHERTIVLELVADEVVERIELDDSLLGAHVDEYLAIIKTMVQEDVPAPRMEALDMAKRVVHDRGGRAIAEGAPHLAEGGLEPFRRLFSLIVALRVDTTMLPAAHRHRL
jgi:uncharacterized protein (UPF0262 family)